MDMNGYCEIVGNNEHFPSLTYSVEVFENPENASVVVLAHTLDHVPVGRISFLIPSSVTHGQQSCQRYLLAAERSFKRMNNSLMQIPRIHTSGLRPSRITGPGGFRVNEFTVSTTTTMWQSSSWVLLHCPNGNGYSIFNIAPPSTVLHPKGVCGSVAIIREMFLANIF